MRRTSGKKIIANRQNAAHSTGPTSTAGKRRSAGNALKHGIFAKDLVLSAEEKPEFDELNNALRRQFDPATPMQEIAFWRVSCACWRCRLATRLEMSSMKKYSDLHLAEGRTGESTPEARRPSKWYGTSRSELRATMRYFADLREQITANGFLHHEDWKEPLTKICGNQEFYDSLMRWKPEVSNDDIRLSYALSEKGRMYGMSMPPQIQADSENGRVLAASLRLQMAIQLIDERMQHLDDLARMNLVPGEGSEEGHAGSNLDGITRYLTTTTKELERAVRWFQELRELGL